MSAVLNQRDVAYVTKALGLLPRRVGLRHLRIALSKWGGQVRNFAAALAPRRTGTLSKGLGVAVKIPDASYDTRHHGKPARVIVGPKRRFGQLTTFKRLKSGILRRKVRVVRGKQAGRADVKLISRYAHFDKRYMEQASAFGERDARTTIMQKLTQGVATEAAKLYQEQPK